MKTKLIHRFLGVQPSTIMKPLTVSFALLLSILTTIAYGQELDMYHGLSSVVQSNIIVRCYNGDQFVSYEETDSMHLFLWVKDDSTIIYAAGIPLDLFVRDFEIYKDLVYFCGYRKSGNQTDGMIGYFRIDVTCHPSPKNFYVYDNIWFASTHSKEFTEMEVYDKYAGSSWAGDSVFLVAVGVDRNGQSLVLEAIGEYDNMANWRYSLGRGQYTNTNETFEQISVTDSFVVTAGTIYNDLKNGMGFRAFDKYGTHDMFSNPSIHDNVYRYLPQGSPAAPTQVVQYPISNRFEMTAIDNDTIATLSLYRIDNGGMPPVMYYGFLLNLYDIKQAITTMNSPCVHSMGTPESYFWGNIYDLKYDVKKEQLVAVLTADVPSWGPQSVFAIIPYAQPLPITFDYNYAPLGYDYNMVIPMYRPTLTHYSYLLSSRYIGWDLVDYYRYPNTTPSYVPQCVVQGQETCDYPGDMMSRYEVAPLKIYRKATFKFSKETMTCVDKKLKVTCRHNL